MNMPKNQNSASDSFDDDYDTPAPAPSPRIVIMLFATVADTTWRLFFPTIGGVVLGIWLDHKYETTPLLTILGVTLGTALSFMLIYMQIRKVKN
jgi:Putative F0F1-ATPase subunit Ca2+/Mg2+ transporter